MPPEKAKDPLAQYLLSPKELNLGLSNITPSQSAIIYMAQIFGNCRQLRQIHVWPNL
jgi:hypothetical protein